MERVERPQCVGDQASLASMHRSDTIDVTKMDEHDTKPATETSIPRDPRVDCSGEDAMISKRQDTDKIIQQDGVSLPLNDLVSDNGVSDAKQVELIVTFVRAEGFTDSASTGIFRRANKGKYQRRYFRVSVMDVSKGVHALASAETSSICAQGPEFRWDSGGENGESLYFLLEPMLLKRGVLLEVEMVHRENAGDYILLGRGQTTLENISTSGNEESQPQWIHLSLEDKRKGRIEIIVSARLKMQNHRTDDADGYNLGGNELTRSPLDSNTRALLSYKDKTLPLAGYKGGDRQRDVYEMVGKYEDPKNAEPSQLDPPKWGMLRMPVFKNTINASIARAVNLKASRLETPNEGDMDFIAHIDVMRDQRDRDEDESGAEQNTGRESTFEDKIERLATRRKAPLEKSDSDDKRGIFNPRYGMQSLKESLQAKLTRSSENSREEREQSNQVPQKNRPRSYGSEGDLDSGSTAYLRENSYSNLPSTGEMRQLADISKISHQSEGDEMVQETEEYTTVLGKPQTVDVMNHASHSPDVFPTPNSVNTASLMGREGSKGPRYSFHQVGSGLSLRSLLQETTHSLDASGCKGGESNSSSGGGSNSKHTPADINETLVTSETERKNVLATQALSSLDVARSIKTTTARLKMALSSPTLTATLKGFGWPKSRGKDEITENQDRGLRPSQADKVACRDQVNTSKHSPLWPGMGQISSDIPTSSAHCEVSAAKNTLRVTVFRASGLSENIVKGGFGRTTQNVTQDTYIKLKMCDVAVATSAVMGEGQECIWGKRNEGECVEISIPASVLSQGGALGSLPLVLEMWNRSNKEREKDNFLGSTEIQLKDWLGRRATWAELEFNGSLGGYVELSVGVKDSDPNYFEEKLKPSQTSERETRDRLRTSFDYDLGRKTTSIVTDYATIDALRDGIEKNNPNSKKKERMENVGSMPTIDEDDGGERGSIPSSNWSSAVLERADVSGKTGSGGGLSPRRNEQVTMYNAVGMQRLLVGPSGNPTTVDITVRVRKADSLIVYMPKTVFGRPKKKVIQGMYVVVDVCGSKQSTLAVIGDGYKCRWSGKHARDLVLSILYADLVATGWGDAPRDSPNLRVEVWNQMSPSRTADAFIGSGDVSLKYILGIGATWIDISRENATTGRVKVYVESPDLHRIGLDGRHAGDYEGNEQRAGETKTIWKASRADLDINLQGDIIEGDESGRIELGPAEEDEERNIGIAIAPERVASDELTISSPGHIARHDPELMQLNNIFASAVEERLSPNSEIGVASQVADDQPQPRDSWDEQTPALAKTEDSESAMISHDEDNTVGMEKHKKTGGIDGRDDARGGKEFTSREFGRATIKLASAGLQRRLQGGAATTLELASTETPARHVKTAPGDENMATTFNSSADATTVNSHVSLTTESLKAQTKEHIFKPHQNRRLGVGESSDDESINRRNFKSPGESLSETNHQHTVICTKRASNMHKIVDEDGDGNVKYLGTEVINQPSSFTQAFNKENQAQLSDGPTDPTTRVDSSSVIPSAGFVVRDKIKRIARARDIAGRRGRANQAHGILSRGHAGLVSNQASSGVVAVERKDRVRLVTIIQRALRGWSARRSLRRCQRAAAYIQAAFRGHRERVYFLGLRARTRCVRAEEQRACKRRSRMASMQQELHLLRRTPVQQLEKIYFLRASAMANRIQRFWRNLRGEARFQHPSREHSVGRGSQPSKRDTFGEKWVGVRRKEKITAPEMNWLRSDREPTSVLTLEALRLRVAAQQRAKQHDALEAPNVDVDAGRTLGTIDSIYESLIAHQDQASSLVGALHRSEMERIATAKRRGERLAKFRRLQNQLLNPPRLASVDSFHPKTDVSTDTSFDGSQGWCRLRVEEVCDKWQVTPDSAEQRRGERAHVLAAAVARGEGSKWWIVSLPGDVGYDELVDIRSVEPPWATTSICKGWRHQSAGTTTDMGDNVAGGRDYDSDEASLWWYTYASTDTGKATTQRREDAVFTELVEKAKPSSARRRERLEDQERKRRLRIARKSQRIVNEVIRQQGATRCLELSCWRGSVSATQRIAAIVIQRRVRGVLQRKKTVVLRSEMRVFGALQILMNELRRPELERTVSDNPLITLPDVLAEHKEKNKARSRHAVSVLPSTTSRSVLNPASVLAEQYKTMIPSVGKDRTAKPGAIDELRPSISFM